MSSAPLPSPPRAGLQPLWLLLAGAVLVAAGWLLPVQVKALSPLLLKEAGAGTPTLLDLARKLRDTDKPGPSALVAVAAGNLKLPGAAALAESVAEEFTRAPALRAWGGSDPYLDQIFPTAKNATVAAEPPAPAAATATKTTPALEQFLPARTRQTVRAFLANSSSGSVRALLDNAKLDRAARFVPATRAGGQPLEATILLTALFQQGRWMSESLASEVRTLADQANHGGDLAPIEGFYFNLLVLARRLDWLTLGEWLRVCPDTKAVADFAQLARVAPDKLPALYAASLVARSGGDATAYALKYGTPGVAGMETALAAGEGAVRQLLLRQVPVNPDSPLASDLFATLSLRHPNVMTLVKFLSFLAGVWFVFRALDRALVGPMREAASRTLMHAKSGAMSLVAAGVLFILSEPFLLRGAPASDYELRVSIPALSVVGQVQAAPSSAAVVDFSTIVSIAFFGCLQVFVYWICLLKMREIERQNVPSLLKLRLMENEENLFDAGLYVGIAGTATALVLQVLGIIQSNLLAAYSSNLFGITCVAVVKIRHVRPYKKKLILESQSSLVPAAPLAAAPAKPAA